MDSNEIAVESKNAKQKHQHEKQWTNPTEFLMTCIGFSVCSFFKYLLKYLDEEKRNFFLYKHRSV